jgi:hypothetical protein
MKYWGLLLGVAGVGSALLPPPAESWTLVIAGDADGYLSPCGCTAPMTGGVRRRATAIRDQAHHHHVVTIDTGGLGGAPGRQGHLKAETAAQIATSLDASAIHLTERDAAMGASTLSSVGRLAEGRLISTSLPDNAVENVKPFAERGPFLIGGASAIPASLTNSLGIEARTPTQAAITLVQAARARKRTAVLMLSGDRNLAASIARAVPGLGIVVYRSSGDPPSLAAREGKTLLVTPGEKGKHVLRVAFDGKAFGSYSALRLDPGYKDDPEASRIYRMYLRRVDRANLLDALPRSPSDPFAGSEACGKCHAKALNVWKKSKHYHGLETLEKDGHGRDPDCVGCHVVGLQHEGGFTSRTATPDLASVGCESCHGAGGKHAIDPKQFKLPKVGERACAPCHTPEQSPNFNFLNYWRKIAH